eukprot:1271816-Rhodomonas_salina.2
MRSAAVPPPGTPISRVSPPLDSLPTPALPLPPAPPAPCSRPATPDPSSSHQPPPFRTLLLKPDAAS